MIEINLLPPKVVLSKKERQVQKLLLLTTGVVTLILTLFLGGMLFWKSQIEAQRVSKTEEQNALLTSLTEKEPQARMLLSIQAKLQGIDFVRQRQLDFGKRVDTIFLLPPTPEGIKSMNWPNGAMVKAEVSLAAADETEALLAKLGDSTLVPSLSNIVAGGLHGTSKGQFDFSFTANYKEAKE